jgi:hypothetical protein
MTLSLAFLAPDIVKAAVEGRLPRGFGLTRLIDLPIVWSDQWEVLGLRAAWTRRLHLIVQRCASARSPEHRRPIVVPTRACFPQNCVSSNSRKLHPGKRNFARRDFGQNRGLIEPGDRPIALGDLISLR